MKPNREHYDIVVIGAGFFGLNIAEYFGKLGKSVLLCERADACMTRASYVNQARIHNGYHYPRSVLTAMRSRVSFPRFVKDFPECVVNDFEKYYGIGKILGKVNAMQFAEFCRRIGAECEDAPQSVSRLFDQHYIEKMFRVKEFAFDSTILRDTMLGRIAAANVELLMSCEVNKLAKTGGAKDIRVLVSVDGEEVTIAASHVFNCTYSNLNFVNVNSAVAMIPLKYEMTEMALVEVPDEIKGKAFTIMCGPFFSLMPFPSRGLYSLSHVRYTPHYEWNDDPNRYVSPLTVHERDAKQTFYQEMVHDAARYMPLISKCDYRDSIWEVKTLLPSSEIDDSRPILCKLNYGLNGYHCVMGGKIDNVYDIISVLKENEGTFK